MKAVEQYFLLVLFVMLYKVVLAIESVDKIIKCDHSNESSQTVLSFLFVWCCSQFLHFFFGFWE